MQQLSPFLLYSALVFPLEIGATNMSEGSLDPHDPKPSTKVVVRIEIFSSYSFALIVSIIAFFISSKP